MGYFEDQHNKAKGGVSEEFSASFHTEQNDAISVESLHKVTNGDIELAYSLLGLFREHSQKYLSDFTTAKTQDERVNAIHALKGAARCIAAHALADIAQEIEATQRQNKDSSEEERQNLVNVTQDIMTYISMVEARKHQRNNSA
ncbi:MAG: Hpt domain-containing protein [Pseudomonadota bacterium]